MAFPYEDPGIPTAQARDSDRHTQYGWHATPDHRTVGLLDAELRDDHHLTGVVNVPLEAWVGASLLRLAGDFPQAGQDRGAIDRREAWAVVVGMNEE
ncbi:hypothetical protein [Streptomyces mirabilis]|uniref:hypothetical protein n=1 Tax=Streptomyces mirabilis TaxID=68239 RepID=UPI0036DADF9F